MTAKYHIWCFGQQMTVLRGLFGCVVDIMQ